jgi:hypothetical protein
VEVRCHKFSRINSPGGSLSFGASPVRPELSAYLLRSPMLLPRWLRRRSNIRTHQKTIRSAAIALSSRSQTPARSSTARSARRAGVNSGPKRQAERAKSCKPYTKRRGTPVVTASPCPHAPQIEGAFETIYPATVATATSMTMSNEVTEKMDRPQFPIDLCQCRTIRADA